MSTIALRPGMSRASATTKPLVSNRKSIDAIRPHGTVERIVEP
jgi:hypothetical protein